MLAFHWRTIRRPGIPRLAPSPAFVTLLLLCGSLFFQGIESRDLWASHEARAAQNAQRMLDDGNWLLPRLYDGQVELQKPPVFYWMVAAIGWLRGSVDTWAVRLPAVIAGMLTVLLVWWHLRQRGRPIAGFVAAAMLAGAVHFTGTARIGRIDVPLACVVTAIMLLNRGRLDRSPSPPASGGEGLGVRGVKARWELDKHSVPADPYPPHPSPLPPKRGEREQNQLTVIFCGLLAGLALLLKGPIGVVLPIAALGVYIFVERLSIRRPILLALAIGLIAIAVAAPWYYWANRETDGEFFRVFILYHHFNRAFGGAEALAGHPWWFYLPRFAADFLPSTPLLLIALVRRQWRGDSDARFGLIWLGVMLAVLSCSRFKRADYLLPAYAGAAIFVGCVIERWYLSRTPRNQARAACGAALLLALLPAWWLVFDHLVTAKEESAHAQAPFASAVRVAAPTPEPVLLFRVESHLLAYHLGRPLHTLVEWAELNDQLHAPGPHFVVTRFEFLDEVNQHVGVNCEVVASSEDVNQARAHRPLILLRIETRTCPNNPPRD